MTSLAATAPPALRPLLRFVRTPKGLCLVIFAGLVALSSVKGGGSTATSRVIVAAVSAAALDEAIAYGRGGRLILPDGAVLTGMIVAFVLRTQESWLVLLATVGLAILSKHLLRTRWSNVLNPAAFALVLAAIVLNTGQSWWGALPDLGITGALVLLVVGGFIADRLNKLPMILAFLGVYFTLFTIASVYRSGIVAETFVTPDLQAALFFAFFMLDDPPTSPVRHEDQVVFGVIVAVVAYFIFMQFGGVYFLPAALLAGNLWESGRRIVIGGLRNRGAALVDVRGRRRLRVAGLGTAAIAVPLMLVLGISATPNLSLASRPTSASSVTTTLATSAVPGTPNAYPFLPSFQG
ncbi:MAG: RnfABCDGE type electron transport complex subunit D, partial [bacterium]